MTHPVTRNDLDLDEKGLVEFVRKYNREAMELGVPTYNRLFEVDGHTYQRDRASVANDYGSGKQGAWELYLQMYARDLKKKAKWTDPILGISFVENDFGMKTDLVTRRSEDVSKKHIGGVVTELAPRSEIYLGGASRTQTLTGTNVMIDQPGPAIP